MLISSNSQPGIRKKRFAVIATVISFWVIPAVGLAQGEIVLKNGQREYQAYCATCHGTQGKGDGPMGTILAVVPVDLTQIRKRNNGEFPFWRVYELIDGRDMVRGHGARGMPVWGAYFLSEEGGGYLDEDRVIGRVMGLVYYLQSIQAQ